MGDSGATGDVPVRLRVGVVTETYAPDVNGCAMTMGRLVRGMLQRGHRVQLVRVRHGRADRHRFEDECEVLPLPGLPIPLYTVQKFGLPAAREVARLWQARRPDAVYIATEGPLGASALLVARLLRIPAVTGFHTNFHTYTQDYGVAFLREAAETYMRELHNRSHTTLVPTDDLRRSLREAGYRNLAVLARGVDTQLYNPARRDEALRRSWGLDREGLAVLYVGRLAQEKNLDLAVESFRAMHQVQPEARFVLVGDGPLRRQLERTDPGFVFCGWQTGTRLANRYASSDVFLFPSMSETFGNVTLEAMASGLAVVAYDYAAARAHIEHGRSGVLAPFGRDEEFVACARGLAADPANLRQLGRAARAAAERLGWDRICEGFERALVTAMLDDRAERQARRRLPS